MAAFNQALLETSYTTLSTATGLTKAQLAQIQSAFYQLLQTAVAPGAVSSVIPNGSNG
jgi:hypothetical protein